MTTVKLSSCDGSCLPHKAWNIDCLAFDRKRLPNPGLHQALNCFVLVGLGEGGDEYFCFAFNVNGFFFISPPTLDLYNKIEGPVWKEKSIEDSQYLILRLAVKL